MAINKYLREAVNFNPTKETYTASVQSLCKDIEEKKIVLPLYQTGIRWVDSKFIDLLNFQLLGKAPVSPISMNLIEDSSKAVEQVTFISREEIEEDVLNKKSVTDGQQRLSCNFYAYSDDIKFKNFCLDLSKGKFVIVDGPIKNNQVPVGKLLNKDIGELNNYKNKISTLKKDEVTDLLYAVRSKLFAYNYTINMAKNLSEKEQIEWFEVLNNAGSKISALQMKFTKFLVGGFDIHTGYLQLFEDKIKMAGMDDAFSHFETRVSFPVSTLNPSYEIVTNAAEHVHNFCPFPSDVKASQLCDLSIDDLKKCIDLTLVALDKAIKFIQDNNLGNPHRMDYISYITGLLVYLGDNEPSEAQKQEIIRWYKEISFTNKSNEARRTIFDNLLSKVKALQ